MTPEEEELKALTQRATIDRLVADLTAARTGRGPRGVMSMSVSGDVAAVVGMARVLAARVGTEAGPGDMAFAGRVLVSAAARLLTIYLDSLAPEAVPETSTMGVLEIALRMGELLIHPETEQTGGSNEG